MNLFDKLFKRKQAVDLPADEPLKPLNFNNLSTYKNRNTPKVCSKCHRTEQEIRAGFEAQRRRGIVVIGDLDHVLLCCADCNKSFCGACQIDLGYYSGCPICNKALN